LQNQNHNTSLKNLPSSTDINDKNSCLTTTTEKLEQNDTPMNHSVSCAYNASMHPLLIPSLGVPLQKISAMLAAMHPTSTLLSSSSAEATSSTITLSNPKAITPTSSTQIVPTPPTVNVSALQAVATAAAAVLASHQRPQTATMIATATSQNNNSNSRRPSGSSFGWGNRERKMEENWRTQARPESS
ncbi:unnamed protein product, partial [Didymodactylos carnosus]